MARCMLVSDWIQQSRRIKVVSYSLVLLYNFPDFRKTLVIHPVDASKAADRVSRFQASSIGWASTRNAINSCERSLHHSGLRCRGLLSDLGLRRRCGCRRRCGYRCRCGCSRRCGCRISRRSTLSLSEGFEMRMETFLQILHDFFVVISEVYYPRSSDAY